jgi:hypothetical protein
MEKLVEVVPIQGIFTTRVYRSGVLIEEYRDNNLVVSGAKGEMAHAIAGDTAAHKIAKIAFGTSGTDPQASDGIITNQYVKPLSGYSFPESDRVQFNWILETSENNGMAILEFGLLTANGTLFARKTRINPIYKAGDISIEGQWTIIIKL